MVTRRTVQGLLAAMVVLVVSLSVLTGFRLLFLALGDTWVARILGGFSLASLVLLLVDVLLLVGTLGVAVSQLLPVPPASEDQSADPSPCRGPAGQHQHGDSISM